MITATQKNCIIENGIRYCQDMPLTADNARATGIMIVLAVCWFVLLLTSAWKSWPMWTSAVIAFGPVLAFGFALILCGN